MRLFDFDFFENNNDDVLLLNLSECEEEWKDNINQNEREEYRNWNPTYIPPNRRIKIEEIY